MIFLKKIFENFANSEKGFNFAKLSLKKEGRFYAESKERTLKGLQ